MSDKETARENLEEAVCAALEAGVTALAILDSVDHCVEVCGEEPDAA